jgi:hypothetical protein
VPSLEEKVVDWTEWLAREGGIRRDDAEELASHLWDLIESMLFAGARPEDAFAQAYARIGQPAALAAEYAAAYEEDYMDYEKQIAEHREKPAELERLYRGKPQAFASGLQRVMERFPDSPVLLTWKARLTYAPFLEDRKKELAELLTLIGLCLLAGVAAKLPMAWGVDVMKMDFGLNATYALNFSFFFLPMIGAFYLLRQRPAAWIVVIVAAAFAVAWIGVNLMPARDPWQTRTLSALHLPLLMWLVVGLAFCGNDWRSLPGRMDFLRYTGEVFIYTVLILLGGGVLTGFTLTIFRLIGQDIQRLYVSWIAVIGLFAAPIVATYLTEKKRGLADNFAPVLSYIFTPLFLVTMVAFLVVMAVLGKSPYNDREFLLLFNAMLALVIALVMFNISERKLTAVAKIYDPLNAVLILVAIAIDAIALSAIIGRLSAFGASPNRIALLGENILLLANLLGLGWQYARFFTGRARFPSVENWTVRYLPVYGVWLAIVVFLFPVVFGYT